MFINTLFTIVLSGFKYKLLQWKFGLFSTKYIIIKPIKTNEKPYLFQTPLLINDMVTKYPTITHIGKFASDIAAALGKKIPK